MNDNKFYVKLSLSLRVSSLTKILKLAPHGGINALREVFDVVSVQCSHRNASVAGHVYVCLFGEGLSLGLCETGKTISILVSKEIKYQETWQVT